MTICLAPLGLALAGCEQAKEHQPAVERALDKAGKTLDRAGQGAKKGYGQAKDRIEAIDWVEAFDDARAGVRSANDKIRERLPERLSPKPGAPAKPGWWTRGAEAVRCAEQTCTVAGWFVAEARSNPTRMIGDVKVLTATDESGWLVDEIKKTSAAYAMGFRKGDNVRTVGGHRLADKWARLRVVETLRKAEEVDVVFQRGEDTRTLHVLFEEPQAPTPSRQATP